MRKTMLLLALSTMMVFPVNGNAMSKTEVMNYCYQHYDGQYDIMFMHSKDLSKKQLKTRKNKILYVEKLKVKSYGYYGLTKDNKYVKFNKKIKKGKTVNKYLIYNPKSNKLDDVLKVF